MDSSYLQAKHAAGLPYPDYLRTGNPQQQENWNRVHDRARLTTGQQALVQSFSRKLQVIGLSGIWCGDCVQQGPIIARIAEANPAMIDLRWLDRDAHNDLQERVKINAGRRVPVLLFCTEDFEFLWSFGDRTLARYRTLAARHLGGACPLPGTPLDADELAATTQDWLNEFERATWPSASPRASARNMATESNGHCRGNRRSRRNVRNNPAESQRRENRWANH